VGISINYWTKPSQTQLLKEKQSKPFEPPLGKSGSKP